MAILYGLCALAVFFLGGCHLINRLQKRSWERYKKRSMLETFGGEGVVGGFDRMMREIDEESEKRMDEIMARLEEREREHGH